MNITITQDALEFILSVSYNEFEILTTQTIPALILKGIRRIDKQILERKLNNDEKEH